MNINKRALRRSYRKYLFSYSFDVIEPQRRGIQQVELTSTPRLPPAKENSKQHA